MLPLVITCAALATMAAATVFFIVGTIRILVDWNR